MHTKPTLHKISLNYDNALVTIMVSDEESEIQVGRERTRTRHDLEDDLESDQIDGYENTSNRYRKGCVREAKRGGYCEALLD